MSSTITADAKLRVLTLNVYQLDSLRSLFKNFLCAATDIACFDDRMSGFISLLDRVRPDLLLLQEAGPHFVTRFDRVKPAWQSRYFETAGLAIYSRYPITDARMIDLPSYLQRGLLIARVEMNSRPLCLANLHLESLPEDATLRRTQLKQLFESVAGCEAVIVAGDFNFGDGAPEQAAIPKAFNDAWLVKGTGPGITYDVESNGLARSHAFGRESSRRLDRILFKGPAIELVSVRRVGTEPPFVSDHFGVLGEFELTPR